LITYKTNLYLQNVKPARRETIESKKEQEGSKGDRECIECISFFMEEFSQVRDVEAKRMRGGD
jgi:hypothetical protein